MASKKKTQRTKELLAMQPTMYKFLKIGGKSGSRPGMSLYALVSEALEGLGKRRGCNRSEKEFVRSHMALIAAVVNSASAETFEDDIKPKSSKDFYLSKEWREVRYKALKASNGICQCCGGSPIQGKPLHVDHIKPRSRFPWLALDAKNLQVLCEDCNIGKGAWDQTDWRSTENKFQLKLVK